MVVSMTQALDAVFENGKFRLLEKPKVPLRDGQHVRLTVETAAMPEDVLELAGQVYAGLSEEEVADVERISLDRRAFFGDREA
jgi:predicted DNA-binding antitoxin AbrB/MazE fold protein